MLHHTDEKVCELCESKLVTAHEYLQGWFRRLKVRYPNVHVSWAWRGREDQEKFFKEGKTRAHFPKSAHNFTRQTLPCSLALDLFLIDEDGNARFPRPWYAKVNDENKALREPIQWGGEWKSIGDGDHFQIDRTRITV